MTFDTPPVRTDICFTSDEISSIRDTMRILNILENKFNTSNCGGLTSEDGYFFDKDGFQNLVDRFSTFENLVTSEPYFE